MAVSPEVNDTDYHQPLKAEYRKGETKLMLDQLQENPSKIPAPSRNKIMQLFSEACGNVYEQLDNVVIYKRNMMTLALDGSEDHLTSRKLFDLVGNEMVSFRKELLKNSSPANLKGLRSVIIPPEGVKFKVSPIPPDKGMELWDGDYIDDNDEDTEQNQEESDGEQNEEPQKEIGDVEDAMPIEETPTTSTVTQNEDVIHLDVIGEAIKAAKVGSSNTLLPHLLKLEGVYLNSRRKLLKSTKSDGIIKEALTATVVSRPADDDELAIVDPP